MSDFTSTITKIDNQAVTAMPAVVAAVQAVEALAPADATGPQKAAAAIQAASQALAGSPNQNVAGIAVLVTLAVTVANALGVFKKKSGKLSS